MTSTAHTAATDQAGRIPARTTTHPRSAPVISAHTIRVAVGRPRRLLFRREETAACSEHVVLADFGKSAALPTGSAVPIEFMPGDPDQHEFTCQMGMLRGRIVVEAA